MSALADAKWRWTADAFEAATDAGIFGPEARVELLDGEVLAVPAMLPGHAETVRVISQLAYKLDETRWTVGSQEPVRLSDDSEPEPDLWIARGGRGSFGRRHPTANDLLLVVEVSDTSLALDRSVKLPGYAAAAVPEAWLVSLPERTVTVARLPQPETRDWGEVLLLQPGDDAVHQSTGLQVPVQSLFRHLAD